MLTASKSSGDGFKREEFSTKPNYLQSKEVKVTADRVTRAYDVDSCICWKFEV